MDAGTGPEGATLVVDLQATVFLCSAGLGMLVKLSKRLHDKGGGVAVARPKPAILKLLRSVGLETVLPSFPTVAAATESLSAGPGAPR